MKIGAYILSYRESDWLKANLDWIYNRFDQISIAIGPSSQNPIQEPDITTVNMLMGYPDKERKIKYCFSKKWKNKDEMAHAAFNLLKCDYLFQVDNDEFWPEETFKEALSLLDEGYSHIAVQHYIFYKDDRYILTSDRFGDKYFIPVRAFDVRKATDITHIPPSLIPKTGSEAECKGHIWHFGWTGKQRRKDKLRYYGDNNIELFENWEPSKKDWAMPHELGPLRVKDYYLNDIPEELKIFVRHKEESDQ